MDSTTTATGSTNEFAVATARIGELNVGAAESRSSISNDDNCQTSAVSARTANVTASGDVVAGVGNSSSISSQCRGQAEQTSQTSEVVNLGGNGVPIPAPGLLRPERRLGGGRGGEPRHRPLPFTGTDVVGLAIAGLLMLAGGLVLRRREVLPRER